MQHATCTYRVGRGGVPGVVQGYTGVGVPWYCQGPTHGYIQVREAISRVHEAISRVHEAISRVHIQGPISLNLRVPYPSISGSHIPISKAKQC